MRVPYGVSAALSGIIGLYGCAPAPVAPEPMKHQGMAAATKIPTGTPTCAVNQPVAGNCVIELTATDDTSDPKLCTLKLVNEDDDLVTLRGAQGNFLYWRIVSSEGYRFTRDGVAFVDNFRPRMFSDGERIGDDNNEFQWQFTGKKRRVNGYVITVRKPNSDPNKVRECELDPWVRNK